MTTAPPERLELSLRDCYAGLVYSMFIHDHHRALRFARTIIKHASANRVPAKWLANAVSVVTAFGKD